MDIPRDSFLPRRDKNMSQSRPFQRQNSFLSPIRTSTFSNRRLSSNRSSLARSPDRTESNRDRKRKRLSLLPANAHLGAPRLINPPNLRRNSNINGHLNNNNVANTMQTNTGSSSATPSTIRNIKTAATPSSVQQLVQNSMTRSGIPLNTHRRSMENRRESTILPSSAASGTQVPSRPYGYSNKPQDPRPIRSHRFQSKIQDELFEYLSANKFDLEMKQTLTQKTLKNPTQKDFVLIFQWLYKKLDPGFKFNRSIEQDVYTLLKFLEYPYLDTINKSQISAVGGSNWPIFLGMLHWLLNLVKESLKFDELDMYSFQEKQQQIDDDFESDSSDDQLLSNEQSLLNNLFLTYVLNSYRRFLSSGEDDYNDFYSDMESDYSAYIEEVREKLNRASDLNVHLQDQLDRAKENYDKYFDELERANALKTDVSKFKNYIDIQKQRQLKWPSVIEKAKSDINNIVDSIKNINKEKQEIISDLEKKNLTLKDIENLHKERAELTASLNTIDANQKQTRQSIESKLETLKSLFFDLRLKIDQYNNSIYEVLSNLSLESPPDATSLIINSLDDEYYISKFGQSAQDVIPILPSLRSSLNDLKNTIQSHSTKLQEDILQSQEVLDDLKLSIVSYTDKLEELEDSLSKSRKEYAELNEKYTTDSSNKQMNLEERAKEIRLFKLQNTEHRKSIESKWKKTQEEYKKTIATIGENRTQLVCDIAQSLDYVVSFKSDIMSDLENAVVEVNQELKQQIESEIQDE